MPAGDMSSQWRPLRASTITYGICLRGIKNLRNQHKDIFLRSNLREFIKFLWNGPEIIFKNFYILKGVIFLMPQMVIYRLVAPKNLYFEAI